jgi:tetratricopeptide (TPR) repeat protein
MIILKKYIIIVDPSQATTPFASINNIGYLQDKDDEVLFSIHTVFRILDIKPMDKSQYLYKINLILTSNKDKDLRALTDRIQTETEQSTGWDRLGLMLFKMGQSNKAQDLYETLLEQATKESEKGDIYYQLGRAKHILGEYREALKFYENSLTIRQQLLPRNHFDLAKCYL